MLFEATIAFLSLMLLTWAAAVWATCREDEGTHGSSFSEDSRRSAA